VPVKCPWASGSISLNQRGEVELHAGHKVQTGTLTLGSSNCSWTDGGAGHYWTGAGKYAPPYTPKCDRIDFQDGDSWLRLRRISTVHIVSMSHLDVGYTGSIAFTLNSYFRDFFPRAVSVAKQLQAQGASEKLHYVTHPWLVYLYANCAQIADMNLDAPVTCPNATEFADFKAAVATGSITWHAGPMNQQAEWMNGRLFQAGVDMSHQLDVAFSLPKKKSVLSLRDVPGMTRSVVPLLRARNVTGITVGMNGGVCAPWVPNGNRMFRWRDPATGAEVVAAWHPGGYPDIYSCPGNNMLNCTEQKPGTLGRRECHLSGDRALCFAFRTDNTG